MGIKQKYAQSSKSPVRLRFIPYSSLEKEKMDENKNERGLSSISLQPGSGFSFVILCITCYEESYLTIMVDLLLINFYLFLTKLVVTVRPLSGRSIY